MSEIGKIKGGLARRKNSKWWYGQYKVDGKRFVKNLHIEVRGVPPADNEEHGSIHFETSKAKAEQALKNLLEDINKGKNAEELAQAVHEARTGGRKVKVYELSDLPRLWDEMPRSKPVSKDHRNINITWLKGFVDYCNEHWPAITKLDHLSSEYAHEYMKWQEDRGISARTWNAILGSMKAACRQGKCEAFEKIRQKPTNTIHRIPFSPEELKLIFEEAETDDFLYPLVITAACTAMRRGDCCKLRWSDVDLKEGFVTVKTSKTGRGVDIPIADKLHQVIAKEKGNGSGFVFPQLASQYDANAKMLTARLRKVLARVGFHNGNKHFSELAPYDQGELLNKAELHISAMNSGKRGKARAVLQAYINGSSLCRSSEVAGISKTTGSTYLNEIEAATGIAFIRGKRRQSEDVPDLGLVQVERETGLRKASVRDFHSFRTTWITLALCAGIPFELVQKVTGHATAEIVLEHYFKPQREQLKTAFQKSMPSLLSVGGNNPSEKVITLLQQMNPENWNELRDKAMNLLLDGK